MADKEMPQANPTTSSTSARTASSVTVADAPLIVAAYDWGALGHVVDVGGADGTLLITLLNEYQALRGTVVDLPGPAETARKMLDAAGLADRGNAVAGDFFGVLPSGAEGYLLCSVLHQWNDEDARTILHNCATAAGEDGAVFVIEKTATPQNTDSTQDDLAQQPDDRAGDRDGDGERDFGDLTALAESAGLVVAAVHTAGTVAVIELAVR